MSKSDLKEGKLVSWKWGNGKGEGKVKEIYHKNVSKQIKGEKITRKGSEENPAVLIEQDDGDRVLKLSSELDS